MMVFFDILVEYQAVPNIENKTLLLIDPMLATGQSMVAVYEKLLEKGQLLKKSILRCYYCCSRRCSLPSKTSSRPLSSLGRYFG
jgi:uracil phosphoribosyltransferase